MRELSYIHRGNPVIVKKILKEHFGLSRGTISSLKTEGGISVNGKNVTVRKELLENDLLILRMEDKAGDILPVKIELDILYEDEDILAVNKPGGMATHPSLGHYDDTLANGVCYMYRDKNFVFRAVNRLDRETSGIVIIAKNRNAAHKIGSQIKEGKIEKVYYAVCCGAFMKKEGIIEQPIARERIGMIKRCVDSGGKYALTEYKVIEEYGNYTLAEVRPKTGRTHQIRVHFAYIGCSVKGDSLYGDGKDEEKLMLHCGKMTFSHPVTDEILELSCPVPEYFYQKNL